MSAKVIPLKATADKAPTSFEFTKTAINDRIAAHTTGATTWRDTVTRGLILRHQRRDWVLGIERKIDGKIFRTTLEQYGPSTDLRQIRAQAEQIMSEVRAGTYIPADIKAAQNRAHVELETMTLGQAFDMHVRVNPQLRSKTVEEYARGVLWLMNLTKGDTDVVTAARQVQLPIASLTTDAVRTAYDRMCKAGKVAAGNSMLRSIRAIWNTWSDETDSTARNPVERITAKRGRVRKVAPRTGALAPDERKPWYEALLTIERNEVQGTTCRAIRMLYLTGLRRDEVLGLKWSEVGKESFTIGAERMKAGEPLTRPITPALRDILDRQKQMNPSSPWVFPATRGNGHLIDTRKTLRHLPTVVTNHDLRRGYIVAGELALVPSVAVKVLVGHSVSDITETYARAIRSELPRLAEQIEESLLS